MPLCGAIFRVRIVCANVDPETIADFRFMWPLVVIAVLVLLVFAESMDYFQCKMSFFRIT